MKLWNKDKKGTSTSTSIRAMMDDLQKQHEQLVDTARQDEDETGNRVSVVLSDLETYMEKLESIIQRLANVTDTLAEQQRDVTIKPWYVRIFCP